LCVCGIVTAVARRWVSVGGYFWWRGGGIALISRLRERGDGCLQKGGKLFLSVPNPPPISFRYKHTSHPVFPSNRVVYFAKVTSHFATPLPNIPTLKWQRLVMIYGPNFILFLFFFFFPVGLPLCRFPPSQFDAAATVHYVCRAIYVVFMHPWTCISGDCGTHQPSALYNNNMATTSPPRTCNIALWPRRDGLRRSTHTRGYIATDG